MSSIGIAVNRHLSAIQTGLSVAMPTVRANSARVKELTAASQRTVTELEERRGLPIPMSTVDSGAVERTSH